MTASTSPLTPVAMGVCLGTREVGLAILTRERLIVSRVLNLKKLVTGDGREHRFSQVLGNLIDAYGVGRVAAIELRNPRPQTATVVAMQRAVLASLAHNRSLTLRAYRPRQVRDAIVREGRASNRAVAFAMADRFPELLPHVPRREVKLADGVSQALANRLLHIPEPRERYWRRMFLAVAVALHDLDEALKLRLFAPQRA